MNIKEAKEEIIHTVQAYTAKDGEGHYRIPPRRQRPLLLMGPPGVGKTAVMEQAAAECGVGLVAYTITHHTRQSAVGLPLVEKKVYGGREYTVTEYTMSEILASVYEQMERTGKREGILFIDEINCVSETLAPTMLQFLQCKTFGSHRVPEGWVIAAAGNPGEYNRSARELDMATLDRVRCLNIEADVGVWREYAVQAGVHGAVLAYLESRPGDFYRVEGEGPERQFVTARGWEDLSDLLKEYERLEIPVTEAVVGEYLACAAVAEGFAAFYRLYRKYREAYPAEGILDGTAGAEARARAAARLREAPAEERLGVTQLLLDGIHRRLDTWRREEADTEFLERKIGVLKGWQAGAAGSRTEAAGCQARASGSREPSGGTPPDARVADFLEKQEQALEVRRQKQVVSLEEERQEERGLRRLRQAEEAAKKAGARDFPAHVQAFEELLGRRREDGARQEAAAGAALDRALAFLSEALGEGQELFWLLADLTRSPDAGRYLRKHPESRYFAYRPLLLVQEQEERLRRELGRGTSEA